MFGGGWTDRQLEWGLIKCSGWCWPWFHLMHSYLPALCFLQELAAEKAKCSRRGGQSEEAVAVWSRRSRPCRRYMQATGST